MPTIALRFSVLALLCALPGHAADPASKPVPPGESAARMKLPPGFKATLFAGEPDLVQPIAFTFDARGRLWVVESMAYPEWSKDGKGKDRVLIFEDTDGDGKFDRRTVFLEDGSNLTGIEVGHGGVWLLSAPNMIFIPVKPGEDKPAGPPVVKLEGWSLEAKHNIVNNLTWGPDGWLYGCHGILATSSVHRPGIPRMTEINCGVWRYHPVREIFEAFAHGTTNPWGIDFDATGQMFITNCVIKHLWHVVQGGRYERMFGRDLMPAATELMPAIVDYIHWAGGDWTSSRGNKPEHSDAGGGHAHSGAMVYLGDNFPAEYRGKIYTCNIHGNRVNCDKLERSGSGYKGIRQPDFLFANDDWYRGITLRYGPDGGVYIADWCDTGECHNYKEVDRTNGRIHKIVFGEPKQWTGDVEKLTDIELADLQGHANEWFVRQSRRVLCERQAAKTLQDDTVAELKRRSKESPDALHRLRYFLTVGAMSGWTETEMCERLSDPNDDIKAWSFRFLVEQSLDITQTQERLTAEAIRKGSPFFRLQAAGALAQQDRMRTAYFSALTSRAVDADDPTFVNMVAYAALKNSDGGGPLNKLYDIQIPQLRRWLVRDALRSKFDRQPEILAAYRAAPDDVYRRDYLTGWLEGVQGIAEPKAPPGWRAECDRLMAKEPSELQRLGRRLAVAFRDVKVLPETIEKIRADRFPDAEAEELLNDLAARNVPDAGRLLVDLLDRPSRRVQAIQLLAGSRDAKVAERLVGSYAAWPADAKSATVHTLAGRADFAAKLLDAVERGTIPKTVLDILLIRQIQALKNKEIDARLGKLVSVQPPAPNFAADRAKYKAMLTPEVLAKADLPSGRTLFAQNCAACHKLYDAGSDIGPGLTGAQRQNLDYLLDNIIDPSAVVPRDYRVTIVRTKSGRTVSGIVKDDSNDFVTLRNERESVTLAKRDIEEREQSNASLMPAGLLNPLTPEQVRDLFGYLMGREQVAAPK